MNNKFANKVISERKVLSIVNGFSSGRTQLTGLTSHAIASWSVEQKLDETHELVSLLYKLGNLCHRLSDRSQESFESLDDNIAKKN
ncbi:MAG: hypothetical protein HOP20_00705 [Sulfuriferula sp.]|nr:hypothetical protein [Sulfuriferula sp.]